MRTLMVLLVVGSMLSPGPAQILEMDQPQPGNQVYALEGLGGLAGLAGGGVCGVAAAVCVAALTIPKSFSSNFMYGGAPGPPPPSIWVKMLPYCALALPAAAGAGLGVNRAGENLSEAGSLTGALVGAYVGLPVALGVGLLGYVISDHNTAATAAAAALGTLAIPAGAVVGYNLSFGREAGPVGSRFDQRIRLPVVMLDRVKRGRRVAEYGVKVQLASMSF